MRRATALTCAFALFLTAVLLIALNVGAQEQSDPRTLLAPQVLNAIANEVSGAQAYNHVVDMCGYERDRPAEEYATTYREADYAARKAQEYGYSDVKIERFPQNTKQWDGEMGELWVTEPVERLVTRYRDLPATLASGSKNADVTAELVYVGRGDTDADYAGKDVKGKIVLGAGPVGALHNLAVRKYGAEGVTSFFNGTGKPVDRPDQIAWSGLTGGGGGAAGGGANQRTTFGFVLSHRMGTDLLQLLESHKKVMVHAKVKANEYDANMQVVTATIPGDGSTDQEVVLVAHLFEGIAKQGGNDNCGGPATQLEAGRAWIKLINEGKLPRPKRTIRFLWVPEISGTNAYFRRYPDHVKHVLAAVDMDMVGADQTKNHNSLHLNTTPDSLPSFLNEVCIQMLEYVGDTNREKIHNRRIAYAFMNPIVDPKGSHDPFWYHIEKFYGASDHQVYIDADPRVPAVQFGNWPDAVYHTSEDTPMFMDPTQMKRSAFLCIAVGQVLAAAGPREAIAITSVTIGHAQRRIGHDMEKALGMIARGTAQDINTQYKEALNLIKQAYIREHLAIRSSAAMMGGDKAALGDLAQLDESFGASEIADLNRVKIAYRIAAKALHVQAQDEPILTAAEKEAAHLFPQRKPPAQGDQAGNGQFGGGGGQRGGQQDQNSPMRGYYTMEARNWADGKHSVLDIRNALSAEFDPIPVESVLAFFHNDSNYTLVQR